MIIYEYINPGHWDYIRYIEAHFFIVCRNMPKLAVFQKYVRKWSILGYCAISKMNKWKFQIGQLFEPLHIKRLKIQSSLIFSHFRGKVAQN